MEFYSKIYNSIELLEEFRKAVIESDIVLEEIISGIHKSRLGGFNNEFLDYRSYAYGDDLRYVDWKVLLRSGKYFVKRFEDNKRNSVFLYIDTSASMFVQNRFLRTLLILAAVANVFLRIRDDVYIIASQDKIRLQESNQNQLINIVYDLYETGKRAKGDFLNLYNQLPEISGKNSIICLFSDLFSDPDLVVNSLSTISGTGSYQYIFHIVNEDELNPSKKGLRLFIDPDSDERLLIQSDNIWDEYKKELNNYITTLNNLMVESGKGKYILCREEMSIRDVLLRFFEKK